MITVQHSATRGRGVFAARPIPAGTVVVRALPFAVVPSDDCTLTHCCVCLQRVGALAPCEGCGSVVMCERCSSSPGSRLIHNDECAALSRLAATPAAEQPRSTRSLRLLLRCLCARWRAVHEPPERQYVGVDGEWWGEGDVAADDADDIDDLVAPPDDEHRCLDCDGNGASSGADGGGGDDDDGGDELHGARLSEALFDMAKQARFLLDAQMRVSHEAAASLMGQLCCNSLTVYGHGADGAREVGVAASASVAMFNHDCEPSADWLLDESGCLVVRTLRDHRPGDELCLSYVDVHLPAQLRRQRLLRHFFFECSCAACAADVARWRCALCGALNDAFNDACAQARCGAARALHAMPVQPRSSPAAAGGARRAKRVRRCAGV